MFVVGFFVMLIEKGMKVPFEAEPLRGVESSTTVWRVVTRWRVGGVCTKFMVLP